MSPLESSYIGVNIFIPFPRYVPKFPPVDNQRNPLLGSQLAAAAAAAAGVAAPSAGLSCTTLGGL